MEFFKSKRVIFGKKEKDINGLRKVILIPSTFISVFIEE